MGTRGRILVADDDRFIREMLRMILTGAGYEVMTVDDGKAAVEKAGSERPDMVITDGLMPKLHGFMACKAIKEMEPSIKVVLLTAVYTKPTYKWEVKEQYGADDVLKKPCKKAELLECIEKHLSARMDSSMQGMPVPGEMEVAAAGFGLRAAS